MVLLFILILISTSLYFYNIKNINCLDIGSSFLKQIFRSRISKENYINDKILSNKIEEVENKKINCKDNLIDSQKKLPEAEITQEKKNSLSDQKLDELMYDDVYRWGIQYILGTKRKVSMYEVKLALDHNGYFGRYKIIPINQNGSFIDEIKIEVYMPSSKMTYVWPHKTTYLMNEGKIKSEKHLVKNDYSQLIMWALVGLVKNDLRIGYKSICDSISNDKKSVVNSIIDKIIELDLGFVGGKLKLKTEKECYEVYANIICHNFQREIDISSLPPYLI